MTRAARYILPLALPVCQHQQSLHHLGSSLHSLHSPPSMAAPVIALSHGGGPMPLLGDKDHAAIVHSLERRVPQILGLGTPSAPRAIVLVTAHWSTATPTISAGESPSLLYDYGGFPAAAYKIKYPARGDASLAREIKALFNEEGLDAVLDSSRGWDHGVFVPMKLVNPAADVPIIQVSVLESEDATAHLRMGQALGKLRDKNIAIVGSGFATLHNFSAMFALRGGKENTALKKAVSEWSVALTAATDLSGKKDRWDALARWRDMPHADSMHPPHGGEHFMPLLVCAGAAGDGEQMSHYTDTFNGVDYYTYYWGGGA